MILEICCADICSVAASLAGGAGRIELCSALEAGGLTPSAGLIRSAIAMCAGRLPVNVLIRPRPGDFLYSESELSVMLVDVSTAVRAGAAGVVIGALTVDGRIDMDSCSRMISEAKSCNPHISVTFHRAFDMCRDPLEALDDIVALGCDRVLTSGMAPSAMAGASMLRMLRHKASGRIMIMAGAGVNSGNIAELVGETDVDEVHASAKATQRSGMEFRREDVAMGKPDADEYSRLITSVGEVRRMADVLNCFKDQTI